MQKHRTHQIDDVAQLVLKQALPISWVLNRQEKDYAKDYLVEIGENNGDLTGSSFFVQLKGQKDVKFTPDGASLKFSLETKHAAYYLDRVKDLPVFLVLVDVKQKKGWWQFLQPVLEKDQSWRKQKTVTVYLPSGNDLFDSAQFREAVVSANRAMRLMHPESIQDAVEAHRQRIRAIDPRFDTNVSFLNNKPVFELVPLQPVSGSIVIKSKGNEVKTKWTDLIDKGKLVTFEPGEVAFTGSKLFEPLEASGGAMQFAIRLPSSVTLTCKDAEGHGLGCLRDVPGMVTGDERNCSSVGVLSLHRSLSS